MKRFTIYNCFGLLCLTLIGLMLPLSLQAQGRITVKTNKKINETLSVKIKANDAVQVVGATGKFKNGSTVSYKLTAQEVSFEGDITEFECQMGNLTGVSLVNTTSLKELVVWINEISAIDLSACPNLSYVNVLSNKLTTLDLSNNTKLTSINCAQNQITNLNIGACTELVSLDCGNNKLNSLDLSANTKMEVLNCAFNNLATLDISHQPLLKNFNCSKNELTALDLSNNREMQILSCFLNKISTLDFANNGSLVIVDCGLNPIESLDVSPLTKVTILDVSGCQLSSIELSKNAELKRLNCHKNKLTALSVANNKNIRRVSCYSNEIKGAQMTQLIQSLRSLDGEPIDPKQAEGEIVVIDTKDPEEKNICTKSDVALALGLDWLVKDFNGKHNNRVDYGGSEDNIITDCIAFSHGTPIGKSITMKIVSDEAVTIEGVSGTWENGKEITYTVDLPRILISGKVKEFACTAGEITGIDLSSCPTLERLDVSINKIASLDFSKNMKLKEVKCEYNPIEKLDFSHNPELTKVWCYASNLNSIDVSQCPELDLLSCSDCQLTALDLSNNKKLTKLACSGNNFGTLELGNNLALEVLWCAKTGLKTLDLTPFKKLRQVLCQFNDISRLDLSQNPELTLFWGSFNLLSELDFSHNPKLLEAFFYDNNIGEDKMEQLIGSLPQRTESDGASIVVVNKNSTTEQNICRTEQVNKAKAKNYKVYAALDANALEKEEYQGSTDAELINQPLLSCYPNPASDYLMIQGVHPLTTARLIDTLGQVWIEAQTSEVGTLRLDLSRIPEGNYLLIVAHQSFRITVKR